MIFFVDQPHCNPDKFLSDPCLILSYEYAWMYVYVDIHVSIFYGLSETFNNLSVNAHFLLVRMHVYFNSKDTVALE